MKIYSWNVYRYNRSIPRVAAYIKQLDFDVLCLQEVPEELLELLKHMPFHLASHVSLHLAFKKGTATKDYAVILSRLPIKKSGALQFPDFVFPPLARLAVYCISRFRHSSTFGREALYVDVVYGNSIVRVFSVHFTLWGVGNRAREFAKVLEQVEPGMSTIICGDFNILEFAPMKILNWLVASSFVEGLPWYPERALFETRFARAGLVNPLRGHITHPQSRNQLDHILVSGGVVVEGMRIESERYGSDHCPVSVTIA